MHPEKFTFVLNRQDAMTPRGKEKGSNIPFLALWRLGGSFFISDFDR
jgi:hypothetical protein